MRIGNWYFGFYNVRKHRPQFSGIDHFVTGDRDCRPFAAADVQSVLMMITNRMRNVEYRGNPRMLAVEDLAEFVMTNCLRIMISFFYDGYIAVDVSEPFAPKLVGDSDRDRIRDEEQRGVVVVLDDIYRTMGKTRAEILKPHIDLLNTVNDTDLNLIMNYGAMGILSPENSSHADGYLDEDAVNEIQKEYREKYGVRFGRWALLITRTPVKFQPIRLPIEALQLNEKRKVAVGELLQYMNVPKELHVMFESAKYANRNEAELDMYGNTVSAWAEKYCEIIRKCYERIALIDPYNVGYTKNVDVWFDINGVPALQAAQYAEKQKAREELAMWRELRSEMPEKSDYIDKRIDDLIESL